MSQNNPRTAEEALAWFRSIIVGLPETEQARLAYFFSLNDAEDTAEKVIGYFADMLATLPDAELDQMSGLIDLEGRNDRFVVVPLKGDGVTVFMNGDRTDGFVLLSLALWRDVLKGFSGALKLEANVKNTIERKVREAKPRKERKPEAENVRRNLEICDLRKDNPQHWSLKRLARRYECSVRNITKILRDESYWRELARTKIGTN